MSYNPRFGKKGQRMANWYFRIIFILLVIAALYDFIFK